MQAEGRFEGLDGSLVGRAGRRERPSLGVLVATSDPLDQYLMRHPDLVLSRGQLLDRVWGGDAYPDERTVDVHIRRVRKALEASGHDRCIQTVRGAGYRFSATGD